MITTVIDCVDLDAEVDFFLTSLGFRIHLVSPADDPRRIVLEHGGDVIELRRSSEPRPASLVLTGADDAHGVHGAQERAMTSPGGSTVQVVASVADVVVPDNVPSLAFAGGDGGGSGGFVVGRAGMEYRDLLPDRWGGRFIASHIRIPDEGDVADWVHFHRIRFQMIYVAAGWVDVVYEDQGDEFRMEAGDCVLQPPEIRHRVLRSSSGFEVIEIGCPAEHDTIADHDFALPTASHRSDRDFGGQRFVRHRRADAPISTWVDQRFLVRDTGIGEATDGLAGAIVVSTTGSASSGSTGLTHDGEFAMIVGLTGTATIGVDGHDDVGLGPRMSLALPAGSVWSWNDPSPDHEALVVTLPADAIRTA